MSVSAKRTYKPADERREQILDCALRAFADRGYHGTSIADVCARAGIGRATLYQYFDDKRDLLVALADRIEQRITGAVAARAPLAIPAGFVPTEEQAVAFTAARCAEILRVVFEDAPSCRLLLRAGRGSDGVVDDMLRRIDEAVLGVIEADLRVSQEAGILRPFDARMVARFFLGGLEKVVLACLDEDRPVDVEAIAREAAILELRGTLADRGARAPGKKTKKTKQRRGGNR
jgi:AcrR family transcriptional regulator